jgi:hypothetical protein
MINPLEDDSRWTLHNCPQCRPSISEVLKDVLTDANLTITVDWTRGGIYPRTKPDSGVDAPSDATENDEIGSPDCVFEVESQ